MTDKHPRRGYAIVGTWGIECPWCSEHIEYYHDPTGTTVRCKVCGDPITVLKPMPLPPLRCGTAKRREETVKCPDADINIGGQP